MEPNSIDVSIIIVNYNTENLIIPCVESIVEKTKDCSYEIIIVDNASPNNSAKKLTDKYVDNPSISIELMSENLGFGKANNEGLKKSRGEYILFLNPDTLLRNDAIDKLWHYCVANTEVGACGGNLFDVNLEPAHSFHRLFPSVFSDFSSSLFGVPERLLFGKNRFFNFTNKVIDVAYITGADLMIPRRVLNETNAFSPSFFMYYEETELCRRIKKTGYRIVSVPGAEIIHLEGKSTKNIERKANFVSKSRNTYYALTHSHSYKLISDFFFMWNCIYRMLYGRIKDNGYFKYWKIMLSSLYKF